MFCLQNGHSSISREAYFGNNKNETEKELERKYYYWKDVENKSMYLPDVKLKYVQGKYIVIKSKNKDIPIGSIVTKINGKEINDYIGSNREKFMLFRDTKRKRGYSIFGEYRKYDDSKDTVEVLCNGIKQEKQINYNKINNEIKAWYYSNPQHSGQNIITDKINNKLAYLRIKSFYFKNLQKDRNGISDFFNNLNKDDNLIIDIRGNHGGMVEYSNFLSSFLTDKLPKYYQCIKNTKFMNERWYYLEQNISDVTILNKETLPKNNYNLEAFNILNVESKNQPLNSRKFKGAVYVLVDVEVYSAAEKFLDSIKTLKNVTIVGTTTGGDGTGFPAIDTHLPKSKLIIKIPPALTINEDGTVDEEVCINPDVYIEQTTNDYSSYLKTDLKDIVQSKYDTVYNKTLNLISKEQK
ncbi:S41 family peptidase [Clostridium botulinum]|uniref:S41 family peptidase n=1 Tax=Clostridium botulinum TaxID=1491 RepID=UPI000A99CD21|nr:S41 family peptidase [Clostridium botulinum]